MQAGPWPCSSIILQIDSFYFIPFPLMHILSGRRGIQFPCNSLQDVHKSGGTKTGFTNNQIHLCPCVGLAMCHRHAVTQHSITHLPLSHLTCVSLFLPSVIPQSLIQSYHLTLTILRFKIALIFAGLIEILF